VLGKKNHENDGEDFEISNDCSNILIA